MTWAKLDDGMWCHPKFLGLSMAARGAWCTVLSWSARNLTDGAVPATLPRVLGIEDALVVELAASGLWDESDGRGWQIHDYLEFNPSKEEVLESRADNRKRVAKHRDRRKRTEGCDSNAVTNGVRNAPCNTPPVPVPVPISSAEVIADPKNTSLPETAREKVGAGGGDSLPPWTERAAPVTAESPEIIGLRWYRELLGRDGPPVSTCRADYTWIGSRKPDERLQVARNIRATTWAASNLSKVTTGHVVRFWAQYADGPRNGPAQVIKVSPKTQAYERMKALEKAYREAERYGEPTEKHMTAWRAATAEWSALPEEARAS